MSPQDAGATSGQSGALLRWSPDMLQDDRSRRIAHPALGPEPPLARQEAQRSEVEAGLPACPTPEAARVESLSRQFDMLADNQLHSLQSVQREIDALRNGALEGTCALAGEVHTLAVAECIEERDKELVRDFNAESMATRAAISELHGRLLVVETHCEGIRNEFKSIYADKNSIDNHYDDIQRQVDDQQARESRRERADSGMTAFAKRIEARIDDLMQSQENYRSHVAQLSQGVEGLIERDIHSAERADRTGCLVSSGARFGQSSFRTHLSSRSHRLPLLRSRIEDRRSRKERATAAGAAPTFRNLQ